MCLDRRNNILFPVATANCSTSLFRAISFKYPFPLKELPPQSMISACDLLHFRSPKIFLNFPSIQSKIELASLFDE